MYHITPSLKIQFPSTYSHCLWANYARGEEMKLIDANIRAMFAGAGDFIARTLRCGEHTLYAYAIDGLITGGDMSDYVIKPIAQTLQGEDMQSLLLRRKAVGFTTRLLMK